MIVFPVESLQPAFCARAYSFRQSVLWRQVNLTYCLYHVGIIYYIHFTYSCFTSVVFSALLSRSVLWIYNAL